jgi:hypothetical protein
MAGALNGKRVAILAGEGAASRCDRPELGPVINELLAAGR